MSQEHEFPSEPIELDVEDFVQQHPGLNHELLLDCARTALAEHGSPPAPFDVHWRGRKLPALAHFHQPNPRSAATLQRPVIVEQGAVVLAGLVLHATTGLQVTRVAPRGSHIDYFVGRHPGDQQAILEVSGTDEESLDRRRRDKQAQLLESRYRHPPFSMPGYVSVSKFARPSASSLDEVPASPWGAS